MASTSLTEAYDKNAATEEWRTGVVDRGADHVYGKTALTAEEWQALDRRPHGEYFLVERTAHRGKEITGIAFPLRADAWEQMHHAIQVTPGAFTPFGPFRLVIREAEK